MSASWFTLCNNPYGMHVTANSYAISWSDRPIRRLSALLDRFAVLETKTPRPGRRPSDHVESLRSLWSYCGESDKLAASLS